MTILFQRTVINSDTNERNSTIVKLYNGDMDDVDTFIQELISNVEKFHDNYETRIDKRKSNHTCLYVSEIEGNNVIEFSLFMAYEDYDYLSTYEDSYKLLYI